MKRIIFLLAGLFALSIAHSQIYQVNKISKSVDGFGPADSACVDFISVNILHIRENAGTRVKYLGKRDDGRNQYRAVCYVPDGEKQVFFISSEGGVETKLSTYLDPHNHEIYDVKVSKIGSIEFENEKLLVVPKENTAGVYVSCKSDALLIQSETGKLSSESPKLENGWYRYDIFFDLSDPKMKEAEHQIEFSVEDKVFVPFTIGKLGPKEGRSIIVMVSESCYERNIGHANESFRKGLYSEAYTAYQDAMNCSDRPTDVAMDRKKMDNMQILTKAIAIARSTYAEAESLRAKEDWLGALTQYQKAQTYRVGILKMNPSDEYCLQYEKIYADLKKTFPREISGKVVDNVRMDMNKQNFPIPNASIMCKVFKSLKVKGKTEEGVDEMEEMRRILGKTDANGEYKIYLPRNEAGKYYQLVFFDDDYFRKDTKGVEYFPTDADIQKGLVIRITPKNINKL